MKRDFFFVVERKKQKQNLLRDLDHFWVFEVQTPNEWRKCVQKTVKIERMKRVLAFFKFCVRLIFPIRITIASRLTHEIIYLVCTVNQPTLSNIGRSDFVFSVSHLLNIFFSCQATKMIEAILVIENKSSHKFVCVCVFSLLGL